MRKRLLVRPKRRGPLTASRVPLIAPENVRHRGTSWNLFKTHRSLAAARRSQAWLKKRGFSSVITQRNVALNRFAVYAR